MSPRIALFGGGLALAMASTGIAAEGADGAVTLLVPNASDQALDLVDPGSGLRLAAIAVAATPRRVTTAPDGRHAAVLSCEADAPQPPGRVALGIVDLEQPRELRRLTLHIEVCPRSLTWLEPNQIVFDMPQGTARYAVDAESGALRPLPSGAPDAISDYHHALAPSTAASSIAVQQFLRNGGQLADLALAPVIPRAVCHACQPSP